MANGDISTVSDQYLQQFNRSVGVSGMQKLQQFPALQRLGYAGQLGHLKNDFHGLQDFKNQMAKYSTAHIILTIAWGLIKNIVPNNVSILRMLFTDPSLGTVGNDFQSIQSFAQVFALTPADLTDPTAVANKTSLAQNQSTQSNTVSNPSTSTSSGTGNTQSY